MGVGSTADTRLGVQVGWRGVCVRVGGRAWGGETERRERGAGSEGRGPSLLLSFLARPPPAPPPFFFYDAAPRTPALNLHAHAHPERERERPSGFVRVVVLINTS